MMITLEEAKNLQYGDILLTPNGKRWKVSGKVQLWKRSSNAHRIRVPLKHGLYAHDALTEDHFINEICDFMTKEKK
jgi:hypothetical protein